MAKRVKSEPQKPIICVQMIETRWTKASRGGEGAVRRGRVPDALVLPLNDLIPPPNSDGWILWLHQVAYGEPNFEAYSRHSVSKIAPGGAGEFFNRDGVTLSVSADGLRAVYQWSECLGAPKRQYPDATGMYVGEAHEALALQPESWGRILYNGRHTDWDRGNWLYEKWLFNIGFLASPAPDVFVATQPVKIFSMMADLW